MAAKSFFDFIHIEEHSATPKYLQLSDAIINAIELENLKKDNLLPSINELSYKLEISRDTAEKGYRYLKKLGVITSVPGKGFYIASIDFKLKIKVFLLFNKLSAHKKIVYDAFIAALGDDASVDFYIYNNDFTLFKKYLSTKKMGDYSHYVIIPHFVDGGEEYAKEVINTIPSDKLILLDKIIPGIRGEYGAVYENFEQDIYDALEQALTSLSKYHTLKIIFPEKSYFPQEILDGFHRFAQQYAFSHQVVFNIADEPINEGEVFIILMEDDLITLLERLTILEYKIGADVGVISYNETPVKKILLNGITTISTDFLFMGTATAKMILENSRKHIEVPFNFTKRASI